MLHRLAVRHRIPTPGLVIRRRLTASQARYDTERREVIATDPIEVWAIAHEFAHHGVNVRRGWAEADHGPRFCRWYVRIVEQEFGHPQGTRLAAAFRAEGVV